MTHIGRYDGITLCLQCQHNDCIGECCPDLLAFLETQIKYAKMNRILAEIAFLLEEQDSLLTSQIIREVGIPRNLVFSLIRQGKIKTERSPTSLRPELRGRGNKIMVVGVELFEVD